MSKPVNKKEFWKARIESAKRSKEHFSVYITNENDWAYLNKEHEKILKPFADKKVLDAGCGYGRSSVLFNDYTGVDFSSDFIALAKEKYPDKTFIEADLSGLPFKDNEFDLAFCVSVKVMIENNLGKDVWIPMEKELKRVAKKVLILEYSDPSSYDIIMGYGDKKKRKSIQDKD